MKRKTVSNILIYISLIFASIVFLGPIVWMFQVSIKPKDLITVIPPAIRFVPTMRHYMEAFTYFPFLKYIFNSIVVATASALLSVLVCLPAAYSWSRFKTLGNNFSFAVLSIRMLPAIVFAIPLFMLFESYGLLDRRIGLILVYTTFSIPLALWILKSFIDDIPLDYEEAAMLDGCSRLRAMISVIFPLIAPAVISVSTLNFIFIWNDFLFALVLTFSQAKTIQLGISEFRTGYEISWGPIAAGGCVTIIPTLVFVILARQYLVRGLTMGIVRE